MTSARPLAAAKVNAVSALAFSFAFTFAPRSTRSVTASALPAEAASMSAVVPFVVALLGSAPAVSNVPIIGASPFLLAMSSGV